MRGLPQKSALHWVERARQHLTVANDYQDRPEMDAIRALNAHDAVEAAIKGVIIAHEKSYPAGHDIAILLNHAENVGAPVNEELRKRVEPLTAYGGHGQYEALEDPAGPEGHEIPEIESVVTEANKGVHWADEEIRRVLGMPRDRKPVCAHGDAAVEPPSGRPTIDTSGNRDPGRSGVDRPRQK